MFRERNDYVGFLTRFALVAERFDWALYTFCLMPTHYHVVVRADRDAMSRGVQRLSGPHAHSFNERYQRTGHLFGDRFTSQLIESDSHLRNVCRYVVLNPVRARLVEHAEDWPWSWSRYGRRVTDP